MKQDSAYQQYLQLKFDELPVQGQPAADWRKLEQALNVAMPVAALSLLVQGKTWLAKKMLWLYLAGLGVGGGAAVVIYQSRQSDIGTKQAIAKTDTVRRKHKTLPPVAPKDTIARKRKTLPPPIATKDTIIRKQKTLPPVASKDTVMRKFKKLPSPYAPKDTTLRKHKTVPPANPGDTVIRKHKNLTPPRYNPKFNKVPPTGIK